MAGDKGRTCPTCLTTQSGKAFKNSEQCTTCRRDISKAIPPEKCRQCLKTFSQEAFHFEKTGRGWRKECRSCHGQQQKDYNANIENQPPRSCKICGATKAAADFEAQRNTCRICKAEEDSKKAALVPKANPETLNKPTHCARCDKAMGADDLTLRQDTHLGSYRSVCRGCLALAKDGTSHTQNFRKRQQERPDYPDVKRHRNDVQRHWHAQNPAKAPKYQAKYRADADCKMRQVIQSAKQRGIAVAEEDVPAMTESLMEPCFYCAFLPAEGQPLNGLDRVNSSIKEYSVANTVPCCTACNHIKAFRQISHFVIHMRSVASHTPLLQPEDGAVIDASFRRQCHHKERPDKADRLTGEQKLTLQTQPCCFCGITPSCGIDRIDSDGDYTLSNVQPCCQECNYGKSSNSSSVFRSHATAVACHTAHWVLQAISHCYGITGLQQQPVACHRDGVLSGVFFSLSKAAAACGQAKCSVADSAADGLPKKGLVWRYLTYEEYAASEVSASAAESLMQKPVSERNHTAEQQSKKRRLVLTKGDESPLEFCSVTAAARHIGCAKSAISQALARNAVVKGWKIVDSQ